MERERETMSKKCEKMCQTSCQCAFCNQFLIHILSYRELIWKIFGNVCPNIKATWTIFLNIYIYIYIYTRVCTCIYVYIYICIRSRAHSADKRIITVMVAQKPKTAGMVTSTFFYLFALRFTYSVVH